MYHNSHLWFIMNERSWVLNVCCLICLFSPLKCCWYILRPEPENILYAQSIMQEAHRRSTVLNDEGSGQRTCTEYRSFWGPHPFDGVPDHAAEEEDRKARDHSAKMLLMMANGVWCSDRKLFLPTGLTGRWSLRSNTGRSFRIGQVLYQCTTASLAAVWAKRRAVQNLEFWVLSFECNTFNDSRQYYSQYH